MTQDPVDDAWRAFGGSPAGQLARRKLVDVLMRVTPVPAANPGALLLAEGERTLARELLTLMDAERTPDASRDDPDAHLRADREPVERRRLRGSERRVPLRAG